MSSSSFLFLIQICVLMLCSFSMEAGSSHNISLGSTLSPLGRRTSSWLSPSGDFAFGFFPVVDDDGRTTRRFLLAIWFDKIHPKIVVWSAKLNQSATVGATLELKTDGRLVLTDVQNRVLWNPPGVSDDDVSYAAMLDDGNFVLASPDGSPRWQSFQNPTDTLLPGQSLLPGNKLQSVETGHSHRRFELRLEANGSDLALYAINTLSGATYGAYWTFIPSNYTQLRFHQSGVQLVLMNESVRTITSPPPGTETDEVYQRATIGPDGVFRHYAHQKNNASTTGWKIGGYIPEAICKWEFTYGSGICGFNSYCIMEEDKVVCKCPPGYSYFDPTRKFGGCKQDFAGPSCEVDESSKFEMMRMVNVDFPLSAYDHFQPMQEEDCKEACSTDCLCAAVIFWNSTRDCWKKRHPMSNGRNGSFVDRTAYIKIPKRGGGGGGSSLAGVATSWGYIMPQIVLPNAKS